MNDTTSCINITGAPSMSELFAVQSGSVGFVFFIVIMTLLAFATFMIYAESYVYIDKKIAGRRKIRLLIVLGIFPFIGVNALLSLYMPRSHIVTFFTSTIYFSLAIYQFLYLIFDYYGGKHALLELLKDETIPLAGPPLSCCCFCCIPPLPMTPRNLKIVKRLVLQVTIVRPLVMFIGMVTWADGTYVQGKLNFSTVNLYVQLLSLFSTLVALWGVIMFVRISKGPLAKYRVTPKFLTIQVCLITVSVQAILIALLSAVRLIACNKEANWSSVSIGNYINDALLVIEMFLFMVVSRIFFRSRHGNTGTLLDDNLPEVNETSSAEKKKELEINNGNANQNNNAVVVTNGYRQKEEVSIPVATDYRVQDIIALSSSDVHVTNYKTNYASNI